MRFKITQLARDACPAPPCGITEPDCAMPRGARKIPSKNPKNRKCFMCFLISVRDSIELFRAIRGKIVEYSFDRLERLILLRGFRRGRRPVSPERDGTNYDAQHAKVNDKGYGSVHLRQ